MRRIIQLVHTGSGTILARVRVEEFSPEYFQAIAQWQASYPPETHSIRFRPRVKLHIDFNRYTTEGTSHHGQEASDHEGRTQEIRG